MVQLLKIETHPNLLTPLISINGILNIFSLSFESCESFFVNSRFLSSNSTTSVGASTSEMSSKDANVNECSPEWSLSSEVLS